MVFPELQELKVCQEIQASLVRLVLLGYGKNICIVATKTSVNKNICFNNCLLSGGRAINGPPGDNGFPGNPGYPGAKGAPGEGGRPGIMGGKALRRQADDFQHETTVRY